MKVELVSSTQPQKKQYSWEYVRDNAGVYEVINGWKDSVIVSFGKLAQYHAIIKVSDTEFFPCNSSSDSGWNRYSYILSDKKVEISNV